jgi:hypothetical protein
VTVARLLALLVAVACGGGGAQRSAPGATNAGGDPYPGELIDSRELPDGVFLRQRVHARHPRGELEFGAVLQTADGVLSLVALTPYDTRAFLLEQRGQQVTFTPYVDRELPFPPRYILLDVQRALFRALPGAPLPDGMHSGASPGEEQVEHWRGGRLLQRSFRRLDGRPAGWITIRYSGKPLGFGAERVELDNAWLGYTLTIRTLAAE